VPERVAAALARALRGSLLSRLLGYTRSDATRGSPSPRNRRVRLEARIGEVLDKADHQIGGLRADRG